LYALFDNKSTENTAWDPPKLSELFVDLKDIGADIELTGFSFDEINEITNNINFDPTSEDDQSRLDEKAKVKCPDCGCEFTP